MARVAAGDRAALREIYEATAPRLYGLALRLLADPGAGAEVLQEAFVAAWKRAGAFDPAHTSTEVWLTAVVRSRALHRLRSAKGPSVGELDRPGLAEDPPRSDRGLRLAGVLGELKPDEAAALRGAYLDGLGYSELGERLGKPAGAARSALRRALDRLGADAAA